MRAMHVLGAALLGAACAIPTPAQCPPGGYNRNGNPGLGGVVPTAPPIPVYNPTDTVAPRSPGPGSPGAPGPSTPGGPSTPRDRSGPTTPRGPGPRGVGGPTTPRGMVMDFRRDDATLRAIDIEWNFPKVPASDHPLAWKDAVAVLADDDRRPILVRRQPHEVEADQAARITALLDLEEVRIMSRWFRCVDVPDATRHPAHPLSGLYFPEYAPLLFIVHPDASDPVGFSGFEPPSEMVRALHRALERAYEGNAPRAVKGIRRILEDYDRLYARERELKQLRDDAIVDDGPDDEKVRKYARKLEQVRAEIEMVKEREAKLSALELRAAEEDPSDGR